MNSEPGRPSRLMRSAFSRLGRAAPAIVQALWQALWQAYGRAVLFLASRGVHLPGEKSVRGSLASQTLSAYERRALVYELKASRYQFPVGPLWLRASVDGVLALWRLNRFWVALFFKGAFGAVFVSLPLGIFLLVRGVLPVPERVPAVPVAGALAPRTSMRTLRPYETVVDTFPAFASLVDAEGGLRRVTVRKDKEGNTPALLTFGAAPRRREWVNAFLASESVPLTLEAHEDVRVSIEGRNRLRTPFFVLPSETRDSPQCRLELRDETGRLLVGSDFVPPRAPGALASRLALVFQSRFTPDFAVESVLARELFIDTDTLPRTLSMSVERTSQDGVPVRAESSDPSEAHGCLVALGEPVFEWSRVHATERRGLVIAVVEGLRAADVDDARNAPFLASLSREGALTFRQHRVRSNIPDKNTLALLGSDGALVRSLNGEGYRTGAFGRFPLENTAFRKEFLPGFDDAVELEAREYEARHITEEAAAWLGAHGEAPFFALAQYSTLLPPFRPPFSYLPFPETLLAPFGFAREVSFRRAMLRYVDGELQMLASKLKALGVWNDIDFVVTSNGALPLERRDFGGLGNFPSRYRASLRLRGTSLLDAELRVPLVWKTAGGQDGVTWNVGRPTFHDDLAVTLASLHVVGPVRNAPRDDASSAVWGVDFSEPVRAGSLLDLNSILSERGFVPLTGEAEIGALAFSSAMDDAFKMTDQFRPRTTEFLRTRAPFSETHRIPAGERMTRIAQGGLGEETLLEAPVSALVARMRGALRAAHFAGGVPLRIEFDATVATRLDFLFAGDEAVRVPEKPQGLALSWDAVGDGVWRLRFEGTVRPLERLRILLPVDRLRAVESGAARFSACLDALRIDGAGLMSLLRQAHPCLSVPTALAVSNWPAGPREEEHDEAAVKRDAHNTRDARDEKNANARVQVERAPGVWSFPAK